MPFAEVNGVKINYREQGSGFPLVLSHGGYSDLSAWDDHVSTLAERYRVIVWDRRNCGESSAAPDADTFDYWVEDLRQLLGHLGVDRAYVGGSSLGSLVSLEFTLAHPEMVEAALLFAGTTAGFEPTERLRATFPNRQGQVGHVTTPVLDSQRRGRFGGHLCARQRQEGCRGASQLRAGNTLRHRPQRQP